MRKWILALGLMVLSSASLFAAHNISEDAIDTVGVEGIPQLIEAIRSSDPGDDEIRIKAVRRLGELKAKESTDMILEILDTTRIYAGGKEIFNWRLKVAACKALADIGDERASVRLVNILRQDNDLTVKRAAAQALGLLAENARKREVLDVMHAELERTRDNALVADICEALGKIGDKGSFVFLLRVTQGPYLNYVKEVAQKSIAMTRWENASVYEVTNGQTNKK